jgi:hypothetical protein
LPALRQSSSSAAFYFTATTSCSGLSSNGLRPVPSFNK